MSSMFNFLPFGRQEQPQAQTQNQPQNPAAQNPNQPTQQQFSNNNPGNQNAPANQNDPNTMRSAVDAYKDLWAPVQPGENEPKAPEFTINPEVLQKVQGSLDFTQGLPDELVQKLQSGEQISNQELMHLLNHVGRTAYGHAMNHQSKLTEKFVGAHGEYSQRNLPKQLRDLITARTVRSGHANPVVQDQMTKIAQQLAQRHPEASEEWIAEQTKQYFVNMAKEISPEAFANNNAGPGKGKETNQIPENYWDDFLKAAP